MLWLLLFVCLMNFKVFWNSRTSDVVKSKFILISNAKLFVKNSLFYWEKKKWNVVFKVGTYQRLENWGESVSSQCYYMYKACWVSCLWKTYFLLTSVSLLFYSLSCHILLLGQFPSHFFYYKSVLFLLQISITFESFTLIFFFCVCVQF